jgi:hypothetical protein
MPVGIRCIERGHPADKHVPEHLHLGGPQLGTVMMSFNPSPSTSPIATWTPPSEARTVRLERRQQNAILGVHVNFRHDAPSRRRHDLVDAIAGEIAGGDPNAALERVPVRCELRQHLPGHRVEHRHALRRVRTLASPMTITLRK